MKRKYQSKDFNHTNHQELSKKTAFHEAGHAAAIYLGNKAKQLPPVFFQILITELANDLQAPQKPNENYVAIVEGGRLIHTLPCSVEQAINDFSPAQQQAYQLAFEADIINMLAGPLAEAQYVALRDDEPINPHLVNFDALKNYGGSADIEAVNDYLNCFIACPEQRQDKVTELFIAAFNFVTDKDNWQAITAVATHLLAEPKNVISCEEVMAVIENVIYKQAAFKLKNDWLSGFTRKTWHQTELSLP
ncbi:MAG: hypothetical protein Q8N35_08460 [Methylococcaceae bacterium]|nr:hypothetical protein [Methylococcaceae bacterium]MDZ4157470.1 hypothetical protein [Methylococcales bacterium]MDP2393198.1 hypothetical protein [Methylococcaceae bacterium]MDP3019606.1 hypothetical protein [Methylococcaceae bacterium]MDP3388984.1 hypothetical protein [Methylococcaceae bacterium]